MARRPKEGAPARGGGRTRDVRPKAKPKPRPRPSAQPSWMGNWKPVAPRIQTSPDADLLLALEAIYGPQRDFIQQTIDAQEKKAAAQAAYQRDWYAKMAQWMQGTIPGAIGGAYNQAAQNQSAFGQGFSDAMKVANQESAAGINANLSQWGAPEGQQVAPGQAEGAADVVYGMGGFIPANTLNQQGAAFSSAANLQIPAYLDSAAKKTLAYLADSDESLAGLRSKLIELQSDRAAKTYSALEDRKAARAKARADAAEAKARARVEQAEALQKYANKLTDDTGYIWIVKGNKVVNTGTPTLDREKAFADEQEPSRISTTLSAEKGVYVDVYGRAVLGRDGKPIPYNPKKSGGSSGGSGSSSGSYLLTVKGGDIYRVDRKTGKMTLWRKAEDENGVDGAPKMTAKDRATAVAATRQGMAQKKTLEEVLDDAAMWPVPKQAAVNVIVSEFGAKITKDGRIVYTASGLRRLAARGSLGFNTVRKIAMDMGFEPAGKSGLRDFIGHILAKQGKGSAAPSGGRENAAYSTGSAPTRGGSLIGTPNAGTHTLGNWESDNAIDVSVPVGTPIYAVADGVIGSQFGPLSSGDPRFAGLRLHLVSSGNEFYYAHLSRFASGIRPGARVRKGQLIGYSGSANGVAHLHFGQRTGDPRLFYGTRV